MKRIIAALLGLIITSGLALGQELTSHSEQQREKLKLPWTDACSSPMSDPQNVSIVQLLSVPERFEGKPVTVVGFYHRGFEHSAIYLSESDYINEVSNNGLWVSSKVDMPTNNGYVIITGIFTTKLTGHLENWPSGICSVEEADKWPMHEH